MKTIALILVAWLAVASASDVLTLTPENFDEHVGGDQPILVEFYAPWCGHCKNLAPEWEIAATAFKSHPVKIAAVDADKFRELGGRHEVKGFPTIKYFPAGDKTGESYQQGRTAADIVDFMNLKAGTHAKIKSAPTAVVVLDPSNFDKIVKDTDKDVLVEFYAPWCGHCKSLTPTYEKVAQSLEGDNGVVIAKVDADAHKELGSQYGVTGFPTIKFFPKNNKDGEDYNEGRSAEDFIRFINNKSGTQRVVGGGYTAEAGRIDTLDELVNRFKSEDKASVLKEIEAALASDAVVNHANKEFAKFYALAAKKIAEGKADYASIEAKRLQRLLDGSNLNAKNRAQFAKRLNIAKLF